MRVRIVSVVFPQIARLFSNICALGQTRPRPLVCKPLTPPSRVNTPASPAGPAPSAVLQTPPPGRSLESISLPVALSSASALWSPPGSEVPAFPSLPGTSSAIAERSPRLGSPGMPALVSRQLP
ncbi:hypothetical protein H920_16971 [Fukomys damarensis]|uniref:Uncharacterized protein n=1 Tax=Fukomys damarensis TaxID=885580 RepID=A0A091DFU8_FUKDA|nr:hypothetical protein H920_16971 [Fukomys damarensis]